MNHARLPSRQRGIVTVLAAILLFAGVIYWLQQTYGIIGNTSQSNATQLDSIKAFFVAESGLERGLGQLKGAGDPTLQTACTGISGGPHTLATGETFTLLATASGCDTSTPPTNCTSCTVTSTGLVDAASRTVQSVISVSAPSGGAYGCGGGGTSVDCPISPKPPAEDQHPDIVQAIEVSPPPAVILSNMAYLRHPAGGANNVNAAATCVQSAPTDLGCLTQWHDESNTSSGDGVVGSRGASAIVTTDMGPGTYKLTQNLTADSLFAAVGAKFGASGTLGIVGSYWSDSGAGGAGVTARNNATAIGSTNNGAACATATGDEPCLNPTIAPLAIPDPPSSGSFQKSRSWCYDADTLVFGFSGKSSTGNSGALTAFTFNGMTSSVPTGTSVAAYPKPAGGTNSELYASLRYIYNRDYLSNAASAYSGAQVTAKTGILNASFAASVTTGSTTMTVTSTGGNNIYSGDAVYCESNGAGCTAGDFVGTVSDNTACVGAWPCSVAGIYTLAAGSTKTNSTRLQIRSSLMQVVSFAAAPNGGWLSIGDRLSANGSYVSTIGVLASGCPAGDSCQAIGNYTLNDKSVFASSSNNVVSKGYTINTSGSNAPTAGTLVEARYPASGKINLATTTTPACVSSSPTPTTSRFYLNAWDSATNTCGTTRLVTNKRLVADQVCGGICALFNHDSADAFTPFTIGISGTSQWAAGITCLKGVNKDDIVGLTGTDAQVKATSWHEVIR